jgi:ABC-2 type transport system ATP-binding protein
VAAGSTVLLTTQYLEEADRLAERIAVVDGGRVIANDTPAALKSHLGNTVIEMGMQDEEIAQRAHEFLVRTLSTRPELEGSMVRLTSEGGAGILIDALRLLEGAQITPVSLTVRQPSLDDVFLALTGHRAESANGSPDASSDGERTKRGAA